MEVTKAIASLDVERGQTDTSLVSERGKTDDSFADHRKQTESETDRRVKSDRQDVDAARDNSRIATDATTDLGRDGRSKVQKNRTLDEKTADESLRLQRDREDEAVSSERSLMDRALVHERNLNDSESNRFLERERKETDKNLLRERTHTDSEALVTSIRLTDELTSHKATKAALTSRDEFLAIVSHDLRNPIGAILSYSELLLEDVAQTGEESRKWAAVIKRNAQTSLRLINDILDMERFAEGKLHMQFGNHACNVILRETVESFSYRAIEREINLVVLPLVGPDLVSCDRDRIGQVLSNLLSNALKFTPAGGTVAVGADASNGSVTFFVRDTGRGVSETDQKRIFDRYTQLRNKDRQGLGLGLYISKMLVDAHQGTIGVDSVMGEGSTFRFTLPTHMRT